MTDRLEGLDLARRAVEAATEKQASDTVLLDVTGVCSFADYFVITTGESGRQLGAIYDEIEHVLKEQGAKPIYREGTPDSGWMVLDYGDVIVHIFAPDERTFYNLEELWGAGRPVLRMQ